ncbi:MAG: hypothetical protein CL946_00505 [Ectothiorhodospiraceae bacterium]|nr:hypothetical protein [Ectothiorhodospiraceae bacterium]
MTETLWHRHLSSAAFGYVVLLLTTHAGLLAWSATRHSPTFNEPGHLVAGLTHWEFGRFEVYRVNPPLVHYVAAMPVMLAGYNDDWSGFYDSPGARPEFKMGNDFIRANGERSIWLFTLARWACIPFSLIGGLSCFFWSRELWGSNLSGLISLFLWCLEPNILAHGELITPDCAASAFGLASGYLFWRWLTWPTWRRSIAAGAVMGLALLSKTSWIILFGLWPLLWILWMCTESHRAKAPSFRISECPHTFQRSLSQLAVLLLVALYVVNFGYGFDGSFTRLREFKFVSKALTGLENAGIPGNRFQDSWQGEVPAPVPMQFLRGIDLQKKDFEDFGQPSYLRGEWRNGGWWYYYLYGLAVKTPHGLQLLLLLAIFTLCYQWWQQRLSRTAIASLTKPSNGLGGVIFPAPRDVVVLMTPAVTLLVLVSSQLEFNQHVRYVLPVLGFSFVLVGVTASWFILEPGSLRNHSGPV